MTEDRDFILTCPYCEQDVRVDADWAMTNDAVCCMNCNKMFDISFSDKASIGYDSDYTGNNSPYSPDEP